MCMFFYSDGIPYVVGDDEMDPDMDEAYEQFLATLNQWLSTHGIDSFNDRKNWGLIVICLNFACMYTIKWGSVKDLCGFESALY